MGVLMGALDIAIVGPALHSIQSFFGVDERAIAWTFTIYVLFNQPIDPVLVLNTGSGLKDVRAAMQAVKAAPVIEPTVEALKQLL